MISQIPLKDYNWICSEAERLLVESCIGGISLCFTHISLIGDDMMYNGTFLEALFNSLFYRFVVISSMEVNGERESSHPEKRPRIYQSLLRGSFINPTKVAHITDINQTNYV